MFGLKKMFGNTALAAKKMEKRQLLEAIVGGCLLVAAADGSISADESTQIDKQLRANKNLEHFGSEITTLVNRFTEQLQAGFLLGEHHITNEIRDIKNDPADAAEVFVNMIVVAQSDGDVSEKELAVLTKIGNLLGLRLKDYGL